MDEENESIEQGSAGFRPALDELVVGSADCDNRKKLEILSDVDIRSVDSEPSSDGWPGLDDLFELVRPFCTLDGACKSKVGLSVAYGSMKGRRSK